MFEFIKYQGPFKLLLGGQVFIMLKPFLYNEVLKASENELSFNEFADDVK